MWEETQVINLIEPWGAWEKERNEAGILQSKVYSWSSLHDLSCPMILALSVTQQQWQCQCFVRGGRGQLVTLTG